ncbi:hypothetical protein ACLQ26_27750 [Micromonospora sp. DT43]|uniref:hypothetical protein n=1 Tax=Micromonospora sp. DT43 TaxID=3393440 RepID=UPI003CF06622
MFEPTWVVRGAGEQGLVGQVKLNVDVDRLRAETAALLDRQPLIFDSTKQLALQIRSGTTDPWYESCYQEKDIAPEREYDTLNPDLAGTYFAEVLGAFPFPVFRARILGLTPRTCYSVHRDDTARFHVAIETSEHAAFVFVEQDRVFRVPADGDGYWLDTREVHTAMNGGRDLRLHIVVGAGTDL